MIEQKPKTQEANAVVLGALYALVNLRNVYGAEKKPVPVQEQALERHE